jgi:hypothetical protein
MTRTADKLEVMSENEKKAFIFKTWNIPVTGADFEEELRIVPLIAI